MQGDSGAQGCPLWDAWSCGAHLTVVCAVTEEKTRTADWWARLQLSGAAQGPGFPGVGE